MQDPFDLAPAAWRRLRELLDAGTEIPAGERERWADSLPAADRELGRRACALLAHLDDGRSELLLGTRPPVETCDFAPEAGAAPGADAGGGGREIGRQVGPYRLERLLGEGGMGRVWLARRADGLLERPVALKLPQIACDREALALRMARERRILATLAHPGIARLYDAGVADDGQPFLALEYVEGLRIDRYCRERRLKLRDRLRLFREVAMAVAYAHARLVVHRDLKPANVLVTGDGQVRLLDFGVAKLLDDEDPVADAPLTSAGTRALTLEYASPEQVRGDAIGIASDVYSLGVLLFELLAGVRPHTTRRRSRSDLEAAILEKDAPRPSSVAVDPQLRRALRGDLDNIVLKALRRQPGERYATVNAFVDDLDRHLANRPVLARPRPWWYRAGKFARRNRVGVALGSGAVLLAIAGVGAVLWQAHVAVQERRRAEEIRSFISSIFREADPYERSGAPVSVVSMLERARGRVDRELASRPALRVELLLDIGASLLNLHAHESAAQALDTALKVAIENLGPLDPLTLRVRTSRLGVLRMLERREALAGELGQLLPVLRERDREGSMLADALRERAHLAIDDAAYTDAVAAAREALRVAETRLGANSRLTARSAMLLALSLEYAKAFDEAERVARRALEIVAVAYPDEPASGDAVEARLIHARVLGESGRLREAIPEMEAGIAAAQAHFGADALEVAFYRHALARYLLDDGQADRAAPLARAVVAAFAAHADPDGVNLHVAELTYATALLAQGHAKRAFAEAEPAARFLASRLPAAHPFAIRAHAVLGLACARLGRYADADRELAAVPQTIADAGAAAYVRRVREELGSLRHVPTAMVRPARSPAR